MYNVLQRLNAVLSFSMSTCVTLGCIIAFLTPFWVQSFPSATDLDSMSISIKDANLEFGAYDSQSRQKRQFAHFNVRLTADLRPLFQWNTKQIFVYLLLEYPTQRYDTNQIVVWDNIVGDVEDAVYDNFKIKNKYAVTDIEQALRNNRNASLSLYWEYVPWMGAMQITKSLSVPVAFS